MRARWFAGRSSRALVVPLMLAAALAGLGPGAAAASACGTGTGAGQPVRPGSSNGLAGVAVASCQAWAVGNYTPSGGSPRTLIEHWDGTAWRQQPSPSPGAASNALNGVTAASASNAWAVAARLQRRRRFHLPAPGRALERHHLDTGAQPQPGRRRRLLPTGGGGAPDLGQQRLGGRASTPDGPGTPVPAHGRALERHHVDSCVPTLNPGGGTTTYNYLSGVAATSATNVWAVGWSTPTVPGVSSR